MRTSLKSAGTILTVLVIALGLWGCGKKSSPKPPSGDEATFPQTYPTE